ncbi:MAG: beta-galactosidase [Candidatus Marinimicrobia bacterium]|nr:beta-galactosidase [Candidatus Neomarinimicrobiota bacterium]
MKKIGFFITISFIVVGLFGTSQAQTESLIYDQLTTAPSGEYYHVPIGLCEDYPEETTTKETYRKDFELLKESGVKYLRISFGWDAIEYEEDKYDWLFWDDFVKTAVEEYGLTLIPYICYTPQWNSTASVEDSLYFWNHPPKDFNEFGEFMGDLVNRYEDYIKTWELWNEPDISVYWQGTTAEFAEFTKIGSRAVKEADPDAKVVLAGLAHRIQFTRELFRDYDISDYVDIVNIHNYFETWHQDPVENIDEYINDIHDIIWRWGDGQPLWMAEVGYSTFRQDSYVSSVYETYYDYEHSPEYQAVDLFKRLALSVATKNMTAIAWYEIKDLPQSEEVIGDEYNNRYLGVAYEDHSPKPAQKALSFFIDLFAGDYKPLTDEVIIEKPLGAENTLRVFEKKNGDVIVVGWVNTHVPGKTGDVRDGSVKDTREETVRVAIKKALKGDATLYNELGEASKYKKVERKKGKTVLPEFTMKGGEITIIELSK